MGRSAATAASLDAFDARRSQELREELPGLEAAFDKRLMRRHLQAAALMLHASTWSGERVLIASIAVFITAWIGQFIGHGIEGSRPSFLRACPLLSRRPGAVAGVRLSSPGHRVPDR